MKNGGFVFYPSDFEASFDEDNSSKLDFFLQELLRKQGREINKFNYKTPQSIILVNKEPERQFVELLFDYEVANKLTSWIKSRDTGFYSLQYILQRGQNPNEFNPDFFIKINNYIIVIETKSDGDITKENYSKYVDAKKHFESLNNILKENNIDITYMFNMLSPESYPDFRKAILDNTYFLDRFRSKLESDLEEKIKNKDYRE